MHTFPGLDARGDVVAPAGLGLAAQHGELELPADVGRLVGGPVLAAPAPGAPRPPRRAAGWAGTRRPPGTGRSAPGTPTSTCEAAPGTRRRRWRSCGTSCGPGGC